MILCKLSLRDNHSPFPWERIKGCQASESRIVTISSLASLQVQGVCVCVCVCVPSDLSLLCPVGGVCVGVCLHFIHIDAH